MNPRNFLKRIDRIVDNYVARNWKWLYPLALVTITLGTLAIGLLSLKP